MNQVEAEKLTEAIVSRVMEKLGPKATSAMPIIAQEVASLLTQQPWMGGQPAAPAPAQPERVVITANGRNRGGIVLRIAQVVEEFSGDIRDINQTIVGDYFTMIVVVDISQATARGSRFSQLKQRLQFVGDEIGVHVVALHDDILTAMHTP